METQSNFTLGRDVGIFGRWLRLIVGSYPLILAIRSLSRDPVPSEQVGTFLQTTGLYFIVMVILYLALFYFLGERVFARADPWLSTLILLGPPALLVIFHIGPQSLHLALGTYINISLILNFIMGYGGCEVIAVPTLVFGRRYTVYCPFNAVDAVENAMISSATGHKILGPLSIIIAIVVGALLLVVDLFRIPQRFDIDIFINRAWSLLLFIPVLFLIRHSWVAYQRGAKRLSIDARQTMSGALALTILTVILLLGLDWWSIWGLAMLAGGLYTLYKLVRADWWKDTASGL